MNRLIRPVARRVPLQQIRHVRAVAATGAPAPVAAVYAQVERDFGMLAPPIALHAADPAVLGAAWCLLRESLLATGAAARAVKEAVAAGVSRANQCPYCVTVHSATLEGLRPAADPLIPAAAAWAGGRADPAQLRLIRDLSPAARAELAGVALTFHYLNRMVSVFLPPSPIPERAPAFVTKVAARLMGSMARAVVPAGPDHEPLLSGTALPSDLAWAAPAPHVAEAVTHAVSVFALRAGPLLSDALLRLVQSRLDAEADIAVGSRPWLDEATAGLPSGERPVADLALLTAIAAYRMTDGIVASARAALPTDDALIAVTAWASFAAARRRTAALLTPLTERHLA
ncbi:carboxymuconolactone decarboxylase family protein [Dactylosporangium sp. CS-033363]|uniref:carboxymuconolactone decarboxylase family protein n=1 Tax=Dactylosporangium sp. CS-033363 TaxID=3239935 RepID=UPI003D8B3C88